ncbi:MAG TPA: peptidylprolyl isomerase [Myxococcota bacterium]|jgi:peptidyl-prolyl cis-trans isomerase A (cyclophilin A)
MKNLPLRIVRFALVALILALPAFPAGAQPKVEAKNPVVTLETSLGSIVLELDAKKAPISVANFLAYVDSGFYDGTVFHRVIPDFMIQGGGFAPDMTQKPTKAPIKNEADNGLANDSWTIAMARTPAKDSATAQFFINLKDNDFLNHGSRDFGYAVFGKVTSGVDVVKKIAAVKTTTKSGNQNVPVEPVVIKSAKRS